MLFRANMDDCFITHILFKLYWLSLICEIVNFSSIYGVSTFKGIALSPANTKMEMESFVVIVNHFSRELLLQSSPS